MTTTKMTTTNQTQQKELWLVRITAGGRVVRDMRALSLDDAETLLPLAAAYIRDAGQTHGLAVVWELVGNKWIDRKSVWIDVEALEGREQ